MKKSRLELLAWLICLCLMLGLTTQASAQTVPPELTQLQADMGDDGLYVSAAIRFDLPAVVEDALLKGIPMYFVAEVDLYRDRWYWYDKKVLTTARHMRLAYQPLTRRWRLNVSSTPITNAGLGMTYNQNYDSMQDALAAVQRISRWKVADTFDLDAHERHNLDFRFRLDMSQLPRPFQIGAVGQSEWNISVSRNQRFGQDSAK